MSRKLLIGLVACVAIVVAILLWWFLRGSGGGPAQQPEPSPSPVMTPTPTLAEQLHGRLEGVSLATADPVLRELAEGLSKRPELMRWLANDDLIRRCVAAVDNIAEGKDPRVHLDFLKPVGTFKVKEGSERVLVDPISYRRYDTFAGVFASLDTEGLARLYSEIKPLLDEADREISPPGSSFEQHLRTAIDELLAVPTPSGEVEVRQKVVTWTYADPALEGLSQAQRHLLRMGPENISRIQAKLREIKTALGL